MADMTKEVVVAACKSNGGYEAPLLNDQLFLHCRGFMAIQNLEPYENAKVLWLEQNAISELSGLEKQQLLVSLFVQNNTIRSLATFSAPLANLRVINVSHNYISSLEGLAEACPQLETLQCSHNRIACLKVCEGLWTLHKSLTSIDLSFNCIESYDPPQLTQPPSSAAIAGAADDIQVVGLSADTTTAPVMSVTGGVKSDPMTIVQFLKPMPLVSVVYLHGNAIIRGIKNYRRNLILHLPALTYVDERPIFTEERRVVEAWGRGGEAAEGEERLAIQREKKEHLNSCVRVLNEKMEANREIRDRLTQQWEAKRAEEFERLKVLRSEQKSERGREEHHEEEARRRIEKEEQDDWWDAEDAFAKEHQRLVETEKQHRHDFEQEEAVKQVTLEASRELTEEAQKPLPTNGPSTEWKELCRSDDDILYEMEMEIQHVLHSVDASVVASMHKAHPPVPAKAAHSDPEALENHDTSADSWMPPSRAVLKAERKVHAAVGETAQRLKADRESRESRWERFEQWSTRHATQK